MKGSAFFKMTEIPIRCFTCGKVVANKWEAYVKMKKEGMPITKVLDTLKLDRPCCRSMLLNHVDLSTKALKFQVMENENLVTLNHLSLGGDDFGDVSDGDDQ